MPKGYRRLKTSIQAYVTVRGRFISETFPLDTSVTDINRWRERTRAEKKYGIKTAAGTSSSFATDALRYLELCKGMPSYQDRKFHIEQWVEAFGDRVRSSITAHEISRVLETWRVKKSLSAGSLNRRRTALMALYTKLDGKSQPNIVKDVAPYDERASVKLRARPMLQIARVIRRVKPHSQARAILRVFMWTGLPNTILKAVRSSHIDWQRHTVDLPPRQKGQGMKAATIPLLPQAVRAFRRYFALKVNREFSNSSVHSALARAVEAENAWRIRHELDPIDPLRVYDIRHSFGTWLAARVKDDRALKELLRTNSIERYTHGANTARLEAALASVTASELAENLQSTSRKPKERTNQ